MTDPMQLARRLWKHVELPQLAQDAISAATAVLTGDHVSEERVKARIEICAACPEVKNIKGKLSCGICGCKVQGDKSLMNLALYEETDKYGCKHSQGSRWKKEGV